MHLGRYKSFDAILGGRTLWASLNGQQGRHHDYIHERILERRRLVRAMRWR
jgi:hypothetical protein